MHAAFRSAGSARQRLQNEDRSLRFAFRGAHGFSRPSGPERMLASARTKAGGPVGGRASVNACLWADLCHPRTMKAGAPPNSGVQDLGLLRRLTSTPAVRGLGRRDGADGGKHTICTSRLKAASIGKRFAGQHLAAEGWSAQTGGILDRATTRQIAMGGNQIRGSRSRRDLIAAGGRIA